jgi:dienelactone hydrolase
MRVNILCCRIVALLLLGQAAPPDAYPPAAEVRAEFLKLLDRPRVPLDVQGGAPQNGPDELVTERLTFASERKPDGTIERVPVYLMRPPGDAGRRPAVLVLHGTGGTKEGQRAWLMELAKRGFVALAIDARYHGQRGRGIPGSRVYNEAIVRAWRTKPGEAQEHPFYYDTVWDIMRTMDYLETRPDVDPKRVGVIGFSMGGIETWLSAVDERIAVAVPAIGVQSFRWSLDHNAWQGRAKTIGLAHQAAADDLGAKQVNADVCRALWNKVIPGILDKFDCPSMLRLYAGRPLLILNGALDPNCPLQGAEIAFAEARKTYDQAGASERLKIMVAEGVAHKVTDEQHDAAVEWLVRWLKPGGRE